GDVAAVLGPQSILAVEELPVTVAEANVAARVLVTFAGVVVHARGLLHRGFVARGDEIADLVGHVVGRVRGERAAADGFLVLADEQDFFAGRADGGDAAAELSVEAQPAAGDRIGVVSVHGVAVRVGPARGVGRASEVRLDPIGGAAE